MPSHISVAQPDSDVESRIFHEWCMEHFYDPEYGERYPELFRDGTPKLTDKGTMWKAAYHLPRSLMNTGVVLEEVSLSIPD